MKHFFIEVILFFTRKLFGTIGDFNYVIQNGHFVWKVAVELNHSKPVLN